MTTQSRITLAANPSLATAVRTAVESAVDMGTIAELGGDIVTCTPGRADRHIIPARLVARLFSEHNDRVWIATPPSGLRAASLLPSATRSTRWQSVPLTAPAEHLDRAVLLRRLTTAGTLIFISDVGDETSTDPLAIGLLARFAHPRQALAARFGTNRDALTAEVALARRPRLIILTTNLAGHAIAAATDDLIAADLVGLALRHEHADPDADFVGPWQHPLVQRATELHLGALIPAQIDLRLNGTGAPGRADTLTMLADRVRLALGLT